MGTGVKKLLEVSTVNRFRTAFDLDLPARAILNRVSTLCPQGCSWQFQRLGRYSPHKLIIKTRVSQVRFEGSVLANFAHHAGNLASSFS